jgi:hypothetical protein
LYEDARRRKEYKNNLQKDAVDKEMEELETMQQKFQGKSADPRSIEEFMHDQAAHDNKKF